jgi:radical SAM superfamily enzyme YgiQ (UPF0313 family)
VRIVLVSTYELGHQPFGLASPKAWLVRAGHEVTSVDIAKNPLSDSTIAEAEAIAFSLPMHTATRLAIPVIERVKRVNPNARIACYGLYAPLNADLLRSLGVEAILGGEFEQALVDWANNPLPDGQGSLSPGAAAQTGNPDRKGGDISLDKLTFLKPDRTGLGTSYAKLHTATETKSVAYTEASRGCKHLCRHCPIVPVYQGQFRVIQKDVVLDDIRQQIAQGATHVTFGDPDFLNGPTHAMRIVDALHAEFPNVTYDVTIKIEHLLKHRNLLRVLSQTGCEFITTAVESLDDEVLAKLEKNHTRQDFFEAAALAREAGLTLQPTFLAFTPWTTIASYRDLLRVLKDLDLVESVPSIQLALRLLITSNSRLLELEDIIVEPFDNKLLVHPWKHPDPQVDALASRIFRLVSQKKTRPEIFAEVWQESGNDPLPKNYALIPRAAVPYLDEPWYC